MLRKRLTDIKYNRAKRVRELIIEMRNIAAQLKILIVEIFDNFLAHLILSINDLLAICIKKRKKI